MEDDVLSLPKQTYSGNQLRIDGYYYSRYGVPEYADVYFFYKDGIVLHGGTFPYTEVMKKETEYKNQVWIVAVKKIKAWWGIFFIEGSKIKFERWHCAEGFCKAYVREGEILNDTTFIVTQSYRMRNGQKTEVSIKNETYRFRPFGPKPDSSNVFIP